MKRTGRTGSTGRTRLLAGVIVATCGVAACSSSAAGPAPEPEVTSRPTSDSIEERETTAPTTTVAPATTTTEPPPVIETVATDSSEPVPESTTAEPLPAPTNTMFDPATLEGEVEQAVLADLSAFVVCLEELPNCNVEKATSNALLAYAEGNERIMTEWNAAGFEARDTADYTYSVDEVELFVDDTEALVIYCVSNGAKQVLPATDVAPEVVVFDEYSSSISRFLVRKIGDRWLVTANDPLETATGEENDLCV